jgi:hypothetical protein
MGTLLLHSPWVQFYLLYLGALGVGFIWDYLRDPPATRDGARKLPNEAAQSGASPPHPSRSQEPGSVFRPGQRTD